MKKMTSPESKAINEVIVSDLGGDKPPDHAPQSGSEDGWQPDLNPTQRLIFDDPSPFILAYGEKGSGKTISLSAKLLRHAYENQDALVLIITPTIRTGNEGIWHDLLTLVLPQWVEGIGLEHSESKLDPNTKERHIWIGNRFGGWSKIMLISIPHASMVEERIKGMSPSFIYVDELTECESREYFTFIAAQLGRRRSVTGPQQYTASCNPKGPSHWVYQVFFVECVDQATGERKAKYAVYHVPVMENVHRLQPGYVEHLQEIFARDPVEKRRLIDGEWVERPSGDAIFKTYFVADFHVRGDRDKHIGLLPVRGFPILVGHDPGPVNYSIHLEQIVPTAEGKTIVLVIDELNYVGKRAPYRKVVSDLLRRMNFWREKMEFEFKYEHISDEAAFNQLRGDGKYDYLEIERLSKDPATGLARIKLKPCPKGADSVPARVRLVASKLEQEELFVSALCLHTQEMFEHLVSEKVPAGKYDPHAGFRPLRSIYIHPFDSLSYPIFYAEFGGSILPRAQIIMPQVYTVGARLR